MKDLITRPSVAALTLGVSAFLAVAPSGAHATVLSRTLTLPSCEDGALTDCADTAYLDSTPADAASAFIGSPAVGGATFTTAFNAWNRANRDDWRLVDGGDLRLTIDATIGPGASDASGGLSPVIFTLDGGSASLLRRLVWTQALVANFTPLDGPLQSPIQTLDTFDLSQDAAGDNPSFPKTCSTPAAGASAGAACGPIYPFQYGSTLSRSELDGVRLGVDPFYDAPQGAWPDASFEAITLLSEVDAATDTLTVFQGVEYGFSLAARGRARSSPRQRRQTRSPSRRPGRSRSSASPRSRSPAARRRGRRSPRRSARGSGFPRWRGGPRRAIAWLASMR